MKTLANVREGLEHVRVVHISLVIVSCTLAYIVVSNWVDAPELAVQIEQLNRDVQALSTGQIDAQTLSEIVPSFADKQGLQLRQDLARRVGHQSLLRPEDVTFASDAQVATATAFFVNRFEPGAIAKARPDEDARNTLVAFFVNLFQPGAMASPQTIEHVRDALIALKVTIRKPVCREEPSADELTQYDVRGGRFRSGTANVSGITTTSDADHITITLGTEIEYSDRMGQRVSEATRYRLNTSAISLNCGTSEEPVPLDAAWFEDRFSHFKGHWEKIKSMPLDQAVAYAKWLRIEPLRNRRFSMLGLDIDGSDIGYAGSILIGCLLVYLTALLENLRENNPSPGESSGDTTRVAEVSPWIGCMKNYWARGITWVSLAGC